MNKQVAVGIGIIIYNEHDQILLGKRKNAHGAGCWAPPGGYLEFGETFEKCAQREVQEETGLTLQNPQILTLTNNIFPEGDVHSLTVFVLGQVQGKPRVCEPDKCETWEYFDLDDLPEPLYLPVELLIEQLSEDEEE